MAFGKLLAWMPNKNEHAEDELYAFVPGVLGVQESPPSPLPRVVLKGVLLLFGAMIVWAAFGRLDIVAVAEGKLLPVTYLKIVQPAEAGVVREIAINEGAHVVAGQILVRMDAVISEADSNTIRHELQRKMLEQRRIEAELSGQGFNKHPDDPSELFAHVQAEYSANRRALEDAVAQERAAQEKARQELSATLEIQRKLERTLPAYRAQEQAYEKLGKDGFAGDLMVQEKQRERIEKEQDLRAQEYTAQSLHASIAQSEKRLAQLYSGYRQKLQEERVALFAEVQKLQQDWAKQEHRNKLLELRAPEAGIVKDLATHTPGTVVSPGTVLMTLVPEGEALQAEVWIKNEDVGFVRPNQQAKLKLVAYPFQKYGMLDGAVAHVSADASDNSGTSGNDSEKANANGQLTYRALLSMKTQALLIEGDRLLLTPGMQVAAEIKLGDQTVLEYLLSPVRKAFHEAGRER